MTARAGETRTVLVVEDDAEIREMLREVLEEEGYEVACAEHGKDALEALEGGLRPALILLDLMMPVMNGWEFLETVGQDERLGAIPVTVVSAVADRAQLGAIPVIRKPINLETLIDTVHGACRP